MKIDIVTARDGGPFQWGQDLASLLNNRKSVEANHLRTLVATISVTYRHPDIVHSTIPLPPRVHKTPLIVTVKGDYTIESILWRELYRRILREAVIVTTPSASLKQKLNLVSAVVIPNAVFPDKFDCPVQRAEKDTMKVITVSNLHFSDKAVGVLTITELLSKLRGREVEYTVVGGGKYLKATEKEATRSTVKPHFTGFLPDPQPLLARDDIFLYYSRHDNFPTAILEAMASGLPVITNNVGAVSEIIDNEVNGYIAQNDDAYLGYLAALLEDKELRETVGANARAKVIKHFNWYEIVNSFLDLYKKLM